MRKTNLIATRFRSIQMGQKLDMAALFAMSALPERDIRNRPALRLSKQLLQVRHVGCHPLHLLFAIKHFAWRGF